MKKIETSALIGLGALGILFGRKMPTTPGSAAPSCG